MPAREILHSASDKMEWLDNFLSGRFFFPFPTSPSDTYAYDYSACFQTFRALNCKTQQNKVRSNSADNEVSRWTDADLWPSAVIA